MYRLLSTHWHLKRCDLQRVTAGKDPGYRKEPYRHSDKVIRQAERKFLADHNIDHFVRRVGNEARNIIENLENTESKVQILEF